MIVLKYETKQHIPQQRKIQDTKTNKNQTKPKNGIDFFQLTPIQEVRELEWEH